MIEKNDIISAMREVFNEKPMINKTNQLVNTIYKILDAYFIQDKKYVVLEAPTGSGKSVIGYVVSLCINKLTDNGSYILTSSKMLQDQIEGDKETFKFSDEDLTILKGTNNYECIEATNRNSGIFVSYKERFCKGFNKNQQEILDCFPTCPYLVKRSEASMADMCVLNYAYFLSAIQSKFGVFKPRYITIADEAHLIPDIVSNMFNIDMVSYRMLILKINNFYINITRAFNMTNREIHDHIQESMKFFLQPKTHISQIKEFIDNFKKFNNDLAFYWNQLTTYAEQSGLATYLQLHSKVYQDIKERFDELLNPEFIDEYFESLTERPGDVFIDSIKEDDYYRIILRDLRENHSIQKYFLNNCDKVLFMSATIGDFDNYMEIMNLSAEDTVCLKLPSTFDFTNSPIYLCESGYLNYQNFNDNINNVLQDCLIIAFKWHGKEKGIIHTSTFNIVRLLRDKLNSLKIPDDVKARFLFYDSPEEKLEMIDYHLNTDKPTILVGPSLYEGLNLSGDMGRFNILIKVPYAGIDNYTRQKMKRFKSWYKNNAIEKTIQAIGRTNRFKDDYSKTYLLDTSFKNIIWETNDTITERLQKIRK